MIYMGDSVLSPDGKFLWTGEEWIPAPPGQAQSTEEQVPTRGGEPSDIGESDGIDSPPYVNHNPLSVPSVNRNTLSVPPSEEDYALQQSGEALGLATTVAGWNGVVVLAMAFTAYSFAKGPVEPEWIVGNDYLVLKALAAAWVIGIILSVYSRVKSAPVQDVETQEQIRILNKTSTVLLALPLLPIALFLLLIYFSMKYGNTATRHH